MMELLANFHFIRPWWLLMLVPVVWLLHRLWHLQQHHTGLEAFIDARLIQHLAMGKPQQTTILPVIALALLWSISILALAGPTWKKQPQPLFQSRAAVIIALDLSPSMAVADVRPSRIIRAHIKIKDLLKANPEALHGLIVYAGEAYVVTPLTDDYRTITNLLPTLEPGILPIPGSNVEMAVELAIDLANKSGTPNTSLLIISDGIAAAAVDSIANLLPDSMDLTVLGIGTAQGGPIPSNQGHLKDKDGNIIIAKYNPEPIKKLTRVTNGYYLPLQADNSDVDFFQQHLQQGNNDNIEKEAQDRTTDLWHEFGPTLLVLILPLAALMFRRGILLSTAIVILTLTTLPQPALAQSFWQKLWKNGDQRGAQAWEQQDYETAAKDFTDPQWKASAQYKTENYEDALSTFRHDDSAIGHYNRGNALAKLQQYESAIQAYDEALASNPNLDAAKINKKRVEDFLKQQQSQQNNSDSDQNQSSQDQQQNGNNDNQESANNPQDNSENAQQDSTEDSQQQNADNRQAENSEADADKTDETSQKEDANDEHKPTDSEAEEPAVATANTDPLSEEEKQALQQWLQKVPDDPSGLLRRKFEYEFQKRRELYQQGQWQLPDNDAHNRY